MPYKPKKPCAYPGCPRLTHDRYCEEHTTKVNKDYEKYGRDPATKKRYGYTWQKVRKRYVDEHPFCELCYAQGIVTPAEHVHHLKPLSEGGTNSSDNLQSLCRSCHSRLHAKRGDRWQGRCGGGAV